MATTVERPLAAAEVVPEQRIVLHGVSWATYEALLADHADRGSPRFAYDRGVLEIMSPTTRHERGGWKLERLVETVADQFGLEFDNVGSMTFKRADLARGFEADAGFYLQNEAHVRDREEIDPTVDPPPDLVIEVDVTHDSLNKLSLYAAMGVPEVWRYRRQHVTFYSLAGAHYRVVETSAALSPLRSESVNRFLQESRALPRRAWLRAVQEWARQQVENAPVES